MPSLQRYAQQWHALLRSLDRLIVSPTNGTHVGWNYIYIMRHDQLYPILKASALSIAPQSRTIPHLKATDNALRTSKATHVENNFQKQVLNGNLTLQVRFPFVCNKLVFAKNPMCTFSSGSLHHSLCVGGNMRTSESSQHCFHFSCLVYIIHCTRQGVSLHVPPETIKTVLAFS